MVQLLQESDNEVERLGDEPYSTNTSDAYSHTSQTQLRKFTMFVLDKEKLFFPNLSRRRRLGWRVGRSLVVTWTQ